MREKRQITLKDLTEEEEILSNKSDLELDLDDNEDFSYSEL